MVYMEQQVKKFFKSPFSLVAILSVFLLLSLPWTSFYLLNDEPRYFWSVKNFLSGDFHIHPLLSPTSFTTIFSGVFVSKISGMYHPAVFRLLSFLTGVLGVYFFQKLIKLMGGRFTNPTALILFFNPLFLYLSFIYTTDIFFITFLLAFFYYAFMFFSKNNQNYLILLSTLVMLMFLTRQIGILLFIPLFYLYFNKRLVINKKTWVALLFPILSFVWYQFFYDKPLAYTYQALGPTFSQFHSLAFIVEFLKRIYYTSMYFGFFLLPFSLSYGYEQLVKVVTKPKKVFILALFPVLFLGIALFLWFAELELMFYLPNIISYAGFNPQNIGDGVKQSIFVDIPFRTKLFITLISAVSSGLVLHYAIFGLKIKIKLRKYIWFVFVSSFLLFGPVILFKFYFDRYLILLVPLSIILFSFYRYKTKFGVGILYVLIFILGIYTFIFEHDYLNLNKKVWEVAFTSNKYSELIKPTNTYASYEYNQFFLLDLAAQTNDPDYLFSHNWIPNKEESEYLISYTDVWLFCRAERVFYPSFMSNYSRNQSYFHIMLKKEIEDGSSCPEQVLEYNKTIYGE